MQAEWRVRKAGLEDVEEVIRLRIALIRSTGHVVAHSEEERTLVEDTRAYLARALPSGRFHAWLAEAGGRAVASSGVVPFERPPNPNNRLGLELYILNMFTEPEWRGRGLARALFAEVMRFAREQGAGRVWLHATPDGRPLYESEGFTTNPTAMEWMPGARTALNAPPPAADATPRRDTP
jgi:GNAT superfamily N-acetyltransferase